MPEPVTLYKSNFRDPVATLRRIADQIEAGEFGEVKQAVLVLDSAGLEVFGFGPQADSSADACMLLQCGIHVFTHSILVGKGVLP